MSKKMILTITSMVILTGAIVLTFVWADWKLFALFMIWLTGYGMQLKAGEK